MSEQPPVADPDVEVLIALPLGEIHIDDELQPRQDGLDPNWIERLKDSEPDDWPPIVVVKNAGRYTVVDGRHRLATVKELGLTELTCRVSVEPDGGDLRGLAFALNRDHGKPLTNPDKKAEAERLLRCDPRQADRDIAWHCGLSNKTVGVVRTRLEATGKIPQLDVRKGRDGKSRPVRARKSKSSSAARSTTTSKPQTRYRSPASFAALRTLIGSVGDYMDKYAQDGLDEAIVLAIEDRPQSEWERFANALEWWGPASTSAAQTLRERMKIPAAESPDATSMAAAPGSAAEVEISHSAITDDDPPDMAIQEEAA
jgi:hypothetical protein